MSPGATADETEDNHRLARSLEAAGVEIDRAFDYLKRMSNQRNQKVFVIAEDIVRTRELPGP